MFSRFSYELQRFPLPPVGTDELLGGAALLDPTNIQLFSTLGGAEKGWAGPGRDGEVLLLPKEENIRRK